MGADHGPAEGDVTVGAASIHWRRDGRGRPSSSCTAFPLSGATWDGVVAHLRDRFTCWTLDLVGLGDSRSTADDDYSSPGQARAFQGLLPQLGVDSYALVGNDTGGWIARELALIDGPRVTRLVLTNTEIPGHRPPWIPLYQALAHAARRRRDLPQLLKLARRSAARRSASAAASTTSAHLDGEFHARFVEPLSHVDAADRRARCSSCAA